MIDYYKLEKSLGHLTLQYRNYCLVDKRSGLNPLDKEAITESVIQRFETCYDCMWKTLKRYLTEHLGLPDLPNSPKPIFQIAFENGLFADVMRWKSYADIRCATTHDYSESKAAAAIKIVSAFITDALALYDKMKEAEPKIK
ncbi:MAG: nucleotidyltransferase substrate binding protein [Prevotellaceae bacterium]|nr:nucleotidyltransferase substrate binding protein [Prevotellaceae bacterium]